jgi:hypothetical protein
MIRVLRSRVPSITLLSFLPLIPSLACDDDGTEPDLITIADFAGDWEATQFKVTHPTNPLIQFDLIALGGSLDATVQTTGAFLGSAEIPDLGAGALTVPVAGAFVLVDQETVQVTFTPEVPPFLTDFTAEFTLTGNTLTLYDEDSDFDFDFDGQSEPAIFEGTLQRS